MNDAILLWANQFAIETPWLNAAAGAYATYGIALFGGMMLVALWIAWSRGSEPFARALLVPVATVGAVIAQQLVVVLVAEPRPYAVHTDMLVLVGRSADGSFPSDHACAVGAAAVALFFVDRRLGWIASGGAVLMAAARVYAGAHWPLDVVAGLALGAAFAIVIELALQGPMTMLVQRLRLRSGRPAYGDDLTYRRTKT